MKLQFRLSPEHKKLQFMLSPEHKSVQYEISIQAKSRTQKVAIHAKSGTQKCSISSTLVHFLKNWNWKAVYVPKINSPRHLKMVQYEIASPEHKNSSTCVHFSKIQSLYFCLENGKVCRIEILAKSRP